MTLYTGNLTPEEHEAEREAEREMTTESLMQTYKISPARYAKGKMAVHCISDGSGNPGGVDYLPTTQRSLLRPGTRLHRLTQDRDEVRSRDGKNPTGTRKSAD